MATIRGLYLYLLVFLVFAAGLIGILLFLRPDAEHAKETITRLFEEHTGCHMRVDSVQPDGMLLPAIRMSGLTLFSAKGDKVASLRWLQADLSISEIVAGNLGLDSVHIVEPIFEQESFHACFSKMNLPSGAGSKKGNDVSILVEGGQFNWQTAPLAQMQQIGLDRFSGHWDGKSNLRLQGHIHTVEKTEELIPVQFSVRNSAEGVDRVKLDMLQAVGTVQDIQNARKIASFTWRPLRGKGHIALNMERAGYFSILENSLMEEVPLKLTADLVGASEEVKIEKLEGHLGEEAFKGGGAWMGAAQEPGLLQLDIGFGVLDKDLAASSVTLLSEQAAFSNLASSIANLPFELDFGVHAAGLSAPGGEIAKAPIVHFVAGLGSITLDQMNVSLPGGTELSFLADFVPDQAGEGSWFASGGLSIQSDNLRRSLAWLGYDLTSVDIEQLRNFRLTGGFDADRTGFQLSQLDGLLDQSAFQGDMRWSGLSEDGDQSKLEMAMKIDGVDLDRYASIGQDDTSLSGSAELADFVKTLSRLNAVDLQLNVKELQYHDYEHKDLALTLKKTDEAVRISLANISLGAKRYDGNQVPQLNVEGAWAKGSPLGQIAYQGEVSSVNIRDLSGLSPSLTESLLGLDEDDNLAIHFSGEGGLLSLANQMKIIAPDGRELGKLQGPVVFDGDRSQLSWEIESGFLNLPELAISNFKGPIKLALDKGVLIEKLTGEFGKGHVSLSYGGANALGKNISLLMENICLGEKGAIPFGPWLDMSLCLNGDLTSSDAEPYFKGDLNGPFEFLLSSKAQSLPAGTAANIINNLNEAFPAGSNKFLGQVELGRNQILLKDILLSGAQGQGDLSLSRDLKLERVKGILRLRGLEEDKTGLSLQIQGPAEAPNMKINGEWLN